MMSAAQQRPREEYDMYDTTSRRHNPYQRAEFFTARRHQERTRQMPVNAQQWRGGAPPRDEFFAARRQQELTRQTSVNASQMQQLPGAAPPYQNFQHAPMSPHPAWLVTRPRPPTLFEVAMDRKNALTLCLRHSLVKRPDNANVQRQLKSIYVRTTCAILACGAMHVRVISKADECCTADLYRRCDGSLAMVIASCGYKQDEMLRGYAFIGTLYGLTCGFEDWVIYTAELGEANAIRSKITLSIARTEIMVHDAAEGALPLTLEDESSRQQDIAAPAQTVEFDAPQRPPATERAFISAQGKPDKTVFVLTQKRERDQQGYNRRASLLLNGCHGPVTQPQMAFMRILAADAAEGLVRYSRVEVSWTRLDNHGSSSPTKICAVPLETPILLANAVLVVTINPFKPQYPTLSNTFRVPGIATPMLRVVARVPATASNAAICIAAKATFSELSDGGLQVTTTIDDNPTRAVLTVSSLCPHPELEMSVIQPPCAVDTLVNLFTSIGALCDLLPPGNDGSAMWLLKYDGQQRQILAPRFTKSLKVFEVVDSSRSLIVEYSSSSTSSTTNHQPRWTMSSEFVKPQAVATSHKEKTSDAQTAIAACIVGGLVLHKMLTIASAIVTPEDTSVVPLLHALRVQNPEFEIDVGPTP